MKNIHLLLIIILFVSCNESKNSVKQLYDEFISKKVIIPNNFDSLLNNDDDSDCKLKMVVYNDFESCTSCVIGKMYLWNTFIDYTKTFKKDMKYYFIFSLKKEDIDKIKNMLNNNYLAYPIIIDTFDLFRRLNPHLPKNSAFHTFLLDENNKVILVGNPLYNKEIEKLFYKKTQELLTK